ncbi:hypothetical protein [Arcobacter porcinus]|uniref:hypothetical protein n=1 Tax=Arcobacter porcinus TaxID=1935204 RepID=UPI0008280480|nr:hypothetical protein [Arcobacter porcinus]OCL89407.1 hypothetical protein AAX27_01938 [Aliarcobacter thereius]
MFINQVEIYGFEYLSIKLEKDLLKKYEDKLKELEKLSLNKQKQLAKEEWFKRYFAQRVQHTQVFKLLKDERTWKKKQNL